MRASTALLANILNRDFCPWANRYVYWLKQPIGWFVLAGAAALSIGVSVAPQALVLFAAISAVTILGIAWPWIGMWGISGSLRFERRRAIEGLPVRVQITVVNRWPWPVWGLLIERGFFAPARESVNDIAAAALAKVPGWSTSTFQWEFVPQRRGRYPLEPPQIASGFPFGIWHDHREVAVENELLVWPRMASLQSVPPIGGRSLGVAGTPSRHVGDEGDMLGVRAYRAGDSLRHVHWAQTAKHDRLVVCERQTTGRRRVQLILDTDWRANGNGASDESLESVIRVGASIGRQFHAHHADIELRAGGKTVVAEPGHQGLHRMLDMLASWSPGDDRDRSIPNTASLDVKGRSQVVVVTTSSGCGRWKKELLHHRDARLIVLDFERDEVRGAIGDFDTGCDERIPAETARNGACFVIEECEDVLARLVRGWEKICHDGWSRI